MRLLSRLIYFGVGMVVTYLAIVMAAGPPERVPPQAAIVDGVAP
jgi:hypothetical protein